MSRVRLGAVGYLNARPHVFGLEQSGRFDIRFDVPSQCAALLHEGQVDAGLIPSIEYLRGGYSIVQAESADAATKIDGKDQPHLQMPESWVEIIEIMPMPGM